MTVNLVQRIQRRAERWKQVESLFPLAQRNLDDNQPGYPSSVGGGSGGSTSSPVLAFIVAAEQSGLTDRAKADWEELQAIEAELDRFCYPLERRLVHLVAKWAIQVNVATVNQYKLANTPREEFCSNCLAHGVTAHRYKDHGDLCRNCYDFNLATRKEPGVAAGTLPPEGILPTQEMCEAWDRKGRINTDMIVRAKEVAMARHAENPDVKKAKGKKSKSRTQRRATAPS